MSKLKAKTFANFSNVQRWFNLHLYYSIDSYAIIDDLKTIRNSCKIENFLWCHGSDKILYLLNDLWVSSRTIFFKVKSYLSVEEPLEFAIKYQNSFCFMGQQYTLSAEKLKTLTKPLSPSKRKHRTKRSLAVHVMSGMKNL